MVENRYFDRAARLWIHFRQKGRVIRHQKMTRHRHRKLLKIVIKKFFSALRAEKGRPDFIITTHIFHIALPFKYPPAQPIHQRNQ